MTASRYIVFAFLLSSASLVAQQRLTLQQAIAMALESNYGLKIAENNEEIGKQAYDASLSGFLPKIDASGTTVNTKSDIRQQIATNGGQTIDRKGANSTNVVGNIGLTYTIFDGLKMFATRERTRLLNESAEISLRQEVLNTVEQVTLAYSELVRLRQQLKALEEIMKISEDRIKVAEAKLNVGLAPKTELLQSKVDYNAQRSEYQRQKALVPAAQLQLKATMGLPEMADVEVQEQLINDYTPSQSSIRGALQQGNQTVLLAKNAMLVNEQLVREYRADLLPRLDFNTNYNYTKSTSEAGIILSNRNRGFNYGFSVNIPLFRGFAATKGLKIARLTAVNANLEYENVLNQLSVETLRAYSTYQVDRELLKMEEENVLLAKENLDISMERFRQSQTSILELRQAQESLQQAQSRLITIRYDTKAAELRLRNLTGDLVK
ncbi:MAG: TolC family protein [Bacteroidota bacterium]